MKLKLLLFVGFFGIFCNTLNAQIGDPSVFGNNDWNVYVYNGTDPTFPLGNYFGYYTESNVSFNTQTRWDGGGSPSSAVPYFGNTVGSDDHSFAAKRQGFTPGYYSIDIPSHDDDALLLIDGVEVWKHIGCCDSHSKVWEGILDANSTVEYRIIEYGGGSYGAITFNNVPLTIKTTVAAFSATSCETTVTVSASGGIPPYIGEGVFTAAPGPQAYSVSDNAGNTASASILVKDNTKPVVNTKNITVNLDPNGQAIVTPNMIDNGSTDGCGIGSYQVATGTSVSPKIYFTGTNSSIWSANRDGSGTPTILYNYRDQNMRTAVGIDVDLDNGNLYFAGAYYRSIFSATVDGVGTINTIPVTSQGRLLDLEIDWDNDKLFYTDSNSGVYATSIDGSAPATQIMGAYGVVALTYDKTRQKIYFVNPSGSIGVVDTDGSNLNSSLFSASAPRGITIDEAAGRLFWIEKDEKKIYTALADGSETPSVLYSFAQGNNYVNNGYGIDFDPGTNALFWTAFGGQFDDTVYTAPADGLGSPKELFVGSFGSVRGIAAGRNIHGTSLNPAASDIVYTSADIGAQTVYLVVTDVNGNVSYAPATVTVTGVAGPIINCQTNVSQSVDLDVCNAAVTIQDLQIANMGDVSSVKWTMTGATNATSSASGINYVGNQVFNVGVTTVSYEATNTLGGISTCSFTVTISESELPVVKTKNITVALNSSGFATVLPSDINDGSTDNCQIVDYKFLTATGTSPKIYFTGTDRIIWSANRDGSGTPTILYDYHDQGMLSSIGIDVNLDNGTLYFGGAYYRNIYNASLDGVGTINTIPNTSQNGNQHDLEIDWENNKLFYTDSNNGVYATSIDGSTPATQIMGAYGVVALTYDKTHQKIYFVNPRGSIGVVDADGSNLNSSLFSANNPRGITIDEAAGRLFWVAKDEKKIYTALADGSETPRVLYSFAEGNNYVYNGYGIDYDPSTNELFWTAFGYQQDNTIYRASADGLGVPVELFVGNFGNIRGIAVGRNIHGTSLTQYVDSIVYTTNDIGVHTENLVVIDASGNLSYAPATVTVIASSPITITCPINISSTVDAGICTASVAVANPQISDLQNMSALSWAMTGATVEELSLTGVNYIGTKIFNPGVTTISYTATGTDGNSVTCSFTVTVADKESPTVSIKNITLSLDTNNQVVVTPNQIDNNSTDNCQILDYKLILKSELSPYIYFTGVNEGKIWKANRDGSGTPILLNSSTAGAAGIEVNYEKGKLFYATSSTNNIQEGDLSGLGLFTEVPNTGLGNNHHDFEYDWDGNRIFYSANANGIYVTSIDGNTPAVQLVNDLTVTSLTFDKTNQKIYYLNSLGIGVVNADGSNKNSTLFSANNPKGITINEATGRLFWVEQTSKKIYTALVDGSEAPHQLYSTGTGNPFGIDYDAVSDNLYWTVFNSGEKVVVAPASGIGTPQTLFSGSFGGLRGIAAGRNIKGNDLSTASSSITFDCSNVGDNIVTLIVSDTNGNVGTKHATVTVEDKTVPVVLTKNSTVQLDATGNASITFADVNNGSTDNCGISLLELDKTSFTCSNVGDNTVTLKVTDSSRNVATQTAIVTVEDKVAPVAIAKNKTIQLNEAGTASIIVADINNGSADNCGIATLTLDKTSFTCADVGENTVTLKVTDTNGNVANQTATVTVEDLIAPVVLTKNITVQLDSSANVTITAADVNNGSTDICGIRLLELDSATFSCANVGDNTVTLKVTDNSGNVSYGTATVTVVNSQPNLIRKHFDNVIFFDNSSASFKSYTWYKNGLLVVGQTAQYFKDSGVLNGTYYAVATKIDGTIFTTCPLTFSASVEVEYLNISPNPVRSNAMYQLITNVTLAKLQNARVTVFNTAGLLIMDSVVDKNTLEMLAPNVEGIYIVKMTLSNGKYFTKNLLVKN